MSRQVIITDDGSSSIWVPELNESYHSRFGARQESMHVFIHAGLHQLAIKEKPIHILEVGFGTGLNALLTCIEAEKTQTQTIYTAIEPFPLQTDEATLLINNFPSPEQGVLRKMHKASWHENIAISKFFQLGKFQTGLADFESTDKYHLVYFDAFSPDIQPELWTTTVFKKVLDLMEVDGILVTYCSKGEVRRHMLAAGFKVEKLPGPKGKREIIRASKTAYK